MKFFLILAAILAIANCSVEQAVQGKSELKSEPKSNKTRVIQGDQSAISYMPYVVSIGVSGHLCSGAIIDSRWILTSAQCVIGLPEKLVRIRYSSNYHSFGGKLAEVEQIITHPFYNRVTLQNDIALIKTKAMEYTGYFARLTNYYLSDGTTLNFIGWGVQTEESGLLSPIVRRIDIPKLPYYECDRTYSERGLNVNGNYHICAGDLYNGGKGFCNGDVGGPLVTWSNDVIYGIASFSIGCGRPGYPGVFTNVPYYYSWIISAKSNSQVNTTPNYGTPTSSGTTEENWTTPTPTPRRP